MKDRVEYQPSKIAVRSILDLHDMNQSLGNMIIVLVRAQRRGQAEFDWTVEKIRFQGTVQMNQLLDMALLELITRKLIR